MHSIEVYDEFCEDAYLNKEHHPWRSRRSSDLQVGWFRITSCEFSGWWYSKYLDVEFLGLIVWDKHSEHKSIKEVIVMRGFKNVRINTGRTVSGKDIALI